MPLVTRDPFARVELHRGLVDVAIKTTCSWCGQKRHYAGKPTDKLYEYRTETDGGRTFEHTGRFCSTPCFDCYHGR